MKRFFTIRSRAPIQELPGELCEAPRPRLDGGSSKGAILAATHAHGSEDIHLPEGTNRVPPKAGLATSAIP